MAQPPPLPPVRWCSRCGASNTVGSNFCHVCGTTLAIPVTPPPPPPPARRSRGAAFGCLVATIIVGSVFVVAVFISMLNDQKVNPVPATTAAGQAKQEEQRKQRAEREKIEREEADLKASVRLTGTQFEIRNEGTFTWRDTKLEINGTFSLLGSGKGYRLEIGDVPPNKTMKVGLMQFANSMVHDSIHLRGKCNHSPLVPRPHTQWGSGTPSRSSAWYAVYCGNILSKPRRNRLCGFQFHQMHAQ